MERIRFIMASPIEIFFSYAHEDEKLIDDVRRQLILFERQGLIQKWHYRQIPPGTEWKGQIDARLMAAQIILLFVSPHFFESDYCYDEEMTEALRRHEAGEARVIPIILRPCIWETSPFSHLQALPKDGKPITTWQNEEEAYLNVARGIMRVVLELKDQEFCEPQPSLTKSHKETRKKDISILLGTWNDDKRQISFGLTKLHDSEAVPSYVITFVLRDRVRDGFKDRVKIDVHVESADNQRAQKVMEQGLSPTQVQYLQGPVTSRAKSLPPGTEDDRKLLDLLRRALRE